MKTVSDFKRAIQIGVKLHTVYHVASKKDENDKVIYLPDGLPEYIDKDMGITQVTVVQSTQFAVEREVKGEKRDSFCSFPKASESKVNGNSITIYEDNSKRGFVPVLTYTILS